ncbi:armadillo repeat-containing protein 3 isoform X2 [Hoplias malabaricus]|uniref:armadillo repeat-containing protein 3 isoform X2 n=1 Tax=Hoplias malabaricus TaxID=27720 RepID=UPI003463812E
MGKAVKKEPEPPPKDVFDPLPIESRKPETVVLMLDSPEEEVLAKACEAIHRFAEKGDENRSTLLGLGAMEPLTRLISHQDKTVRRNALMALGVMASNNGVRRLLKKLNIIPSIISKLSPEEDVVLHEFATLCLASLSVDSTCKVQIFDHNGLEPLIRLLSSSDPDVTKNSVECIFNLVQDQASRMAVHQLSGLPPLLELLRSDFPVIQQLTLQTLENITKDHASKAAFREKQGFNTLMEILTNREFSDLHADALRVISNCLEDTEAVKLFKETGGLEKLLQFITTPNSPEVQMSAVKAITRVAQSSENRKILHEQDVEKTLTDLLVLENSGVRAAVCQAIAEMGKNTSSKDTFRLLDGIRPIVQMLNNEGVEVKEAAAQALSSLTFRNEPNALVVSEAGGEVLLVKILQDGRLRAADHAASVLTNLASQEALRHSIITCGAAQALMQPLQSPDKNTLISSTQTVAALACDADGRGELRNAGVLPPLVKLLKSNDVEIRRSACWAITVCANDEPTTTEVCKLGALEILQEINSSVNRRSKFSQEALKKLLESNLSVKYSLTGCLSHTDIITDGFYDPGQVREGERVPVLEDLAKQVLNQKRAVIAVNGKPPEHVTAESAEDRQQGSPTETRTSSVQSSKGSIITPSKTMVGGRQDDDKPQQVAAMEKPWTLPFDSAFHDLVTTAKTLLPQNQVAEVYNSLAKLVCDAMGGPVDIEKQHDFAWDLHISELKFAMKSNIIPIGKIKKGTYYHRALLYKALADRIGVSCSLVRGEYNRAWNEVLLSSPKKPGSYPQFQRYIIDLMHQPGNLMKCGSPAATQYQMI